MLTLDKNEQENLSVLSPEPTLQEGVLFLENVVDDHDFLRS